MNEVYKQKIRNFLDLERIAVLG
jgi:predicted CoA-binding protein